MYSSPSSSPSPSPQSSPSKSSIQQKMNVVKTVYTSLPSEYQLFDVKEVEEDHPIQRFYVSIIHCDSIDKHARKVALLTDEPLRSTSPVTVYYDKKRILPASDCDVERVELDGKMFNKSVHYTLRILAFLSYKESFVASHLPYLILPVTEEGKVGWDEISKTYDLPYSVQIRDDTFQEGDLDHFEGRAVFEGTQPWTDRPFIPLKFRSDQKVRNGELEGKKKSELVVNVKHKKFAKVDFEQINLQSTLLEMRNIPPFVNFLAKPTVPVKVHNYSTLPSLCMLGALSAGMLCSARLLPAILTAFERTFLVRKFQSEVLTDLPIDQAKLSQALTLPSANMDCDYQQLEFLGDCILKLIVSCIVFCQDGSANEGELTTQRTRWISNENLTKVSERLHVAEHCFGPEAIPKQWKPHGLWQRSLRVSQKTSADLIEAILGAAWLSGEDSKSGLKCVFDCFNKLSIQRQRASMQDFHSHHEKVWNFKEVNLPVDVREHVSKLEKILGYKFNYPQLAIASLTHSSVSDALKPSYQRLEFLGDAVLDVCIVQLFDQIYPMLDEGQYSILKSVAASNLSWGIACINTGLPELILHDCASLHLSMLEFRSSIEMAKINAGLAKKHGETLEQPFWTQIEICGKFRCPRQISDIVESVIGAVFVDSRFDLEVARKIFRKVFQGHFLTYFGKGKVV